MKKPNLDRDLWSKIQDRKNFDSQVKMHLPNLPKREPKIDLWESIEEQLDSKKPVVIPIWRYGLVAASLALVLSVIAILFFQLDSQNSVSDLITAVQVEIPKYNPSDLKSDSETKLAVEIDTSPEVFTPKEKAETSPEKTIKENSRVKESIKIPEIDLPELEFSLPSTLAENFQGDLIKEEERETLHQVSISWNKLKPRMKILPGFGKQNLDLGNQQQASANQSKGQLTIEIKN